MDTQRPPRKRAINIRLPGNLIDRIDRAARATGTTRTEILTRAAQRELQDLEPAVHAVEVTPRDDIPTPAEVNAQPMFAHKRRVGLAHLPNCHCPICKPGGTHGQ